MVTIYCVEKHELELQQYLIEQYGNYKQAMDVVREHDKVGWKVGITIQLKAESAKEEAEERAAEVYRNSACCHSGNKL